MTILNVRRAVLAAGLSLSALALQAQRSLAPGAFNAQQGGYSASAPESVPAPVANSVLLDRVVAVINGDVILQSDVVEEEHFVQLQPYNSPGEGTLQQQALQHLVNRTLILQQLKEQQSPIQVADAEVKKQIDDLRKHLPACAPAKCESDAGWKAMLAAHGFTEEGFNERWRKRMTVLSFIEQRFRQGIRISKPEIQAYYNNAFVPQFKKRNLTPPPLTAVSSRIDEILLQQHVNGLLAEWLTSLKDQGSVAILDPQYEQPGQPVANQNDTGQGDDQ